MPTKECERILKWVEYAAIEELIEGHPRGNFTSAATFGRRRGQDEHWIQPSAAHKLQPQSALLDSYQHLLIVAVGQTYLTISSNSTLMYTSPVSIMYTNLGIGLVSPVHECNCRLASHTEGCRIPDVVTGFTILLQALVTP